MYSRSFGTEDTQNEPSSFIGNPGCDMNLQSSRAAVVAPSIHRKSSQTVTRMTQFSSRLTQIMQLKTVTRDATAYILTTNMVSFVCLYAEKLAGEYVVV
ncbi:hypothetical protein TNCV_3625101 [Trichonephila clavipes]|nr:hypothetical protein TNCV_3625101 [Trichonephila clavipes]